MTLGELKTDLRKHGIRPIAGLRMRKSSGENGWDRTVIYFSSDEKVVFPFAPKNVYSLVMRTGADDEVVHPEKVKALKRTLLPDWDEE